VRRNQLRSAGGVVVGAGCGLVGGEVVAFGARRRANHVAEVGADVEVEVGVGFDVPEDDDVVDVDVAVTGRADGGAVAGRVNKGIVTLSYVYACFGGGLGVVVGCFVAGFGSWKSSWAREGRVSRDERSFCLKEKTKWLVEQYGSSKSLVRG
jgi:hypothetical protein